MTISLDVNALYVVGNHTNMKMMYMACHIALTAVQEWKEQTMKYLEATDSNGTELYLFQLENNLFISVPKEQFEFKPLSSEELKEMKETDDE